MKFCITANGNVAYFESPQGCTHMYGDGFGFCESQNGYPPFTDYFDHEHTESGNWDASAIIQPKGPNTFPSQIVRSTADGIWILTQTFMSNPGEQTLKVVMQLKNNSFIARSAYVERYADIDADGTPTHNFSLGTETTGFTSDYYGIGRGLEIHALPNVYPGEVLVVAPNTSTACYQQPLGQPYWGDGALQLIFRSSSIAPGATKTVSFEYRPI